MSEGDFWKEKNQLSPDMRQGEKLSTLWVEMNVSGRWERGPLGSGLH